MSIERYKTALELLNSGVRSMEQRNAAFLTIQSFLIAAYCLLLTRYNNSLFFFLLGISLVGISICLLIFVAGRTTSIDVSIWRSYMRDIESTNQDNPNKLPWQNYDDTFPKRAGWPIKEEAKKLPGVTLWLTLPGWFLIVWTWALVPLFFKWYYMVIAPIITAAILTLYCLFYFIWIKIKE